MSPKRQPDSPVPSRSALLAARPLHNPSVTERSCDDGTLELAAPIRKGRLGRWLTGNDEPLIKRFQLDKLGSDVWRMIDGHVTVREMIERFAQTHQLNLREAEVAVLTYLETLTTRSLALLAISDENTAGRD